MSVAGALWVQAGVLVLLAFIAGVIGGVLKTESTSPAARPMLAAAIVFLLAAAASAISAGWVDVRWT